MSVNPISERQIIVLTTDGRLSLIELEGAASLLLNNENRSHNISRPIMCLEDMIPGKNSIQKSVETNYITYNPFFAVLIFTYHFEIQVH